MLGLHTATRRKAALAIASAGAIIGLSMSPAVAADGVAQAEGSAASGTGIFDPVAGLLETDSCKARFANGTLTRNEDQCTPSIETSPAQAVTRYATANVASNGAATSSAEGGVASVPLTDLGQLDLTELFDSLANTNVAASALGPLIAQLGQIGQQLVPLTGPIDDALQQVLQGVQQQLPISLEVGAVIARCDADGSTAHASSEVADVSLQVTLGPQEIPVIFETPVESHSDLVMHAPHQLVDGILSGIEDSLLSAQGPLEPLLAALKLLVTNIDQQVVDALLDALEPTLLSGLSDALAPIVRGEVNHVSNPPHATNQDGPWTAPEEIDLTALSLTVLDTNTLTLGHVHCGDNVNGGPNGGGPGLKFDKDADTDGSDAKFTLTVKNTTNAAITGVFVQDFYGKDIDAKDVKDVKVSQGTFNKNTGRWDVGTVGAGQTEKLTFKVDVDSGDLNDGVKNAACVNKATKPGHIQKNDGVGDDTDGCDEATAKKDNDSDSDSDSDSDGPKSVDSGLNDGGNFGPLAIAGLLAASTLVGSAARQRLLLDR
jgi:hypothetical protein